MTDRYPFTPGAKGSDGTSLEATRAIAPSVTRLRSLALTTLASLGEATTLEAVSIAGVERESLQPRFSELRALCFVESTGKRRPNPSGKNASVLRLTERGKKVMANG